jgi:hypothetical protein
MLALVVGWVTARSLCTRECVEKEYFKQIQMAHTHVQTLADKQDKGVPPLPQSLGYDKGVPPYLTNRQSNQHGHPP